MPFEIRKNSKGVNTKVYVPSSHTPSPFKSDRQIHVTDYPGVKGITIKKSESGGMPSMPFGPKPRPGAQLPQFELPGEAKMDRAIGKGAKAIWTAPEKMAERYKKSEELKQKEKLENIERAKLGLAPVSETGFFTPQQAREARLKRVKAEKELYAKTKESEAQIKKLETQREVLFTQPPMTPEERVERSRTEMGKWESMTPAEKEGRKYNI